MKLKLEDHDIEVGSFRRSGQVVFECQGCGSHIGVPDTNHTLAECLSQFRQRLEALESKTIQRETDAP